jgi:PAT family beta-lactamase induction signal transducer AmpG
MTESSAAGQRSFIHSLAPYVHPRPLASFLLGISSGFPLTLLLATMTYWLSKIGIDKKTIGFAVALGTPYTLKFLWAPLIDGISIPILTRFVGQRRAWLYLIQLLLFLSIIQLGASDPAGHIGQFALWAIVVAFLSATQDIVIDAYRIEILSDEELPHGTANNQFGYRTGNLLAGAGTVYLASPEGANLGWAAAYALTAWLVVPGAIASLWAGAGLHRVRDRARLSLDAGITFLRDNVWAPFADFLRRRGAVLILLFVLIAKLGDAMGQIMLSPMIVELGFTDTEYIAVNKLIGFWALIAGSAVGAPFIAWLGMGRALVWACVIMMLTNLGFAALAYAGHDTLALSLAVGFENFATGIGATVFTTYLSGLSNLAYTATQFALLSSLASVGRTFLAAPSGIIAEQTSWATFYVITVVVALPGLLLIWLMWRRGFVADSVRQSGVDKVSGEDAEKAD